MHQAPAHININTRENFTRSRYYCFRWQGNDPLYPSNVNHERLRSTIYRQQKPVGCCVHKVRRTPSKSAQESVVYSLCESWCRLALRSMQLGGFVEPLYTCRIKVNRCC
jgi:hypothetical protein